MSSLSLWQINLDAPERFHPSRPFAILGKESGSPPPDGAPQNRYWQASQSGSVIEQALGAACIGVTSTLTAFSALVWMVDFSAEVAPRVRR
jgi:hypothetical protein